MTKTIQPYSFAMLGEMKEDFTIKTEIQENMKLLLSLYNSLINLYNALDKMDYASNNLCKELTELKNTVCNI